MDSPTAEGMNGRAEEELTLGDVQAAEKRIRDIVPVTSLKVRRPAFPSTVGGRCDLLLGVASLAASEISLALRGAGVQRVLQMRLQPPHGQVSAAACCCTVRTRFVSCVGQRPIAF